MSLASTFQADDDAPAAALVANELTSMDPCAMAGRAFAGNPASSDEVNASLRETGALLATTRPGVRCTAAGPGRTHLRGLLVPGWGQYSTSSRVVGLAVSSLVVFGAIASISKLAQSNSLYARYQANHSATAPQIYNLAQDRRFGARQACHRGRHLLDRVRHRSRDPGTGSESPGGRRTRFLAASAADAADLRRERSGCGCWRNTSLPLRRTARASNRSRGGVVLTQ